MIFPCYHPRYRGDNVFILCVCVCVCVCLCLSRCFSGRFNYEGLVPHKPYFTGTLLVMSSRASYVSCTHDVIDNVTRLQSRSNFEIHISPSIFEPEHRSKAQNIGNANGYLSGIFNFQYNFQWKSLSQAQNGGHFKNTTSVWPQIWKYRSQLGQKIPSIFMLSRGWLWEQVARAMSRQ